MIHQVHRRGYSCRPSLGNRIWRVLEHPEITHLAIPACFSDGDRFVRLGGINPDENLVALLHGSSPVRPGSTGLSGQRAQSAHGRRATSTAQRTCGLTVPGPSWRLTQQSSRWGHYMGHEASAPAILNCPCLMFLRRWVVFCLAGRNDRRFGFAVRVGARRRPRWSEAGGPNSRTPRRRLWFGGVRRTGMRHRVR
jgi:hypothetical protein